MLNPIYESEEGSYMTQRTDISTSQPPPVLLSAAYDFASMQEGPERTVWGPPSLPYGFGQSCR
jgi:hypothetical protein